MCNCFSHEPERWESAGNSTSLTQTYFYFLFFRIFKDMLKRMHQYINTNWKLSEQIVSFKKQKVQTPRFSSGFDAIFSSCWLQNSNQFLLLIKANQGTDLLWGTATSSEREELKRSKVQSCKPLHKHLEGSSKITDPKSISRSAEICQHSPSALLHPHTITTSSWGSWI